MPQLNVFNAGSLKALRAARVLRPLKLVSGIPSKSKLALATVTVHMIKFTNMVGKLIEGKVSDRRTNQLTDRQTDQPTDQQTDRQTTSLYLSMTNGLGRSNIPLVPYCERTRTIAAHT